MKKRSNDELDAGWPIAALTGGYHKFMERQIYRLKGFFEVLDPPESPV